MSLARHEPGIEGAVRALASQVHPIFMLPPLAASAFGAILAGQVDYGILALHLLAAFFALYTAHVKDGYVDFHLRGEDDDHPITETGCRRVLLASSVGFFACLLAVGILVDPVAALLTLPGWLVGYLHAPQLDMHPVTATAGYPTGIAFALVGGHYVQAEGFAPAVVALSGIVLLVLSGIKVIDDAKDYEYDRSIGKRTVAVVLGREKARRTAYAMMGMGLLAVLALAAVGVLPTSAAFAPVAFALVALLAARADDRVATMLLIRGSYVFLAVLVAAVWFRPFA